MCYYRVVTSHAYSTFIKLILICFKFHAGTSKMVADVERSSEFKQWHHTELNMESNEYSVIFGITIDTMLTECALIVSGTLTLQSNGLWSVTGINKTFKIRKLTKDYWRFIQSNAHKLSHMQIWLLLHSFGWKYLIWFA